MEDDKMNVIEAVISGIVQGITEFLPVSSSGHLVMLHTFFGYREPKLFEDVLLHLGTLVAVIIFFWKDILALFREKRFLLLIIMGSVPAVITSLFFGKEIELFFANIKIVAAALLVTGLWLLLADLSLRTTNYELRTTNLTIWHALLIGISQAIALVPGISRSGATVSTGLLLKRHQELAFRFSFLLSVPAILGALFYKMKDLTQVDVAGLGVMMWGGLSACLVGIFALWSFKKILFKKRLYFFSIYCFCVGGIMLFM